MRTHTRKIIVAIILASAVVSTGQSAGWAEAEQKPALILAGNTETVWVILPDKDGTEYKLAVRQAGDKEKWKPVGGDWTGSIVSATSSGASLVVFFPNGETTRYFPHRNEGLSGKLSDDLFGEGAQILASASATEGNNAVMALIARPIKRPPQTQPAATTTTSQPAKPGELALLQYVSQKWRQVAVVPGELIKSATRAHVAVHKNTIYILAEHPKEVLAVFEDGKWREVDLPDMPAGSKPLAMMIIEDALVLAMFDAEAGVVNFAGFASNKWQPTQPVRRDGKNLTWSADAPPAIARFAGKAAMMWKSGEKWFFTTCEPDGQAGDESPMNAFALADEQEQVKQVQNIFFMVVFGVIVVLMFWPGQTLRTAPFSLPATIPPARLTRRFAAACIDTIPFLFVVSAVGLQGMDSASITTIVEQAKQAASTTRFIYAFLGFLVVYPAYCFVMEYRFGATVGKMILRLRIVADKGRKPSLRELALRNVSKAIEILGLVMVFPLLFPLLTRYRQRLGDKIAWTTVINADAVGQEENQTDSEKTENRPDDNNNSNWPNT